jgi:2-methylisocitrate lyase-like PEP mutase family enzyme
MTTQQEKGTAFRALHERHQPFLIPNPWDRGTALLLEHLGFEALATTSLGVANMLGRKAVTKQHVLDNCRLICEATSLPVNADLENCFSDDPREAADVIRLASECGAAGGSIEDWSGNAKIGIYSFELAVERVHAAVEVARSLPAPFLLTARAENFLHGRRDLDDTIKRLQAFEAVGAEVLYAPGLHSLDEMRTVAASVTRPLNVVMGFADPSLTLDQLATVGVKRVSIGGGLSCVALNAFLRAAREMRAGRFGFISEMAPIGELHSAFD